MPAIFIGQSSSPANPVLDIYLTDLVDAAIDVNALEFQIWDCHTPVLLANPTILYPTIGADNTWQVVNVSGADHLATGRYVASWTPGLTLTPGDYEIRWRYRLQPYQQSSWFFFRELFEVIVEGVLTASANAVIQSQSVLTASANAVIQAATTLTSNANAVIQAASTLTASANAVVQASAALTASANAVIQAATTLTAGADAVIVDSTPAPTSPPITPGGRPRRVREQREDEEYNETFYESEPSDLPEPEPSLNIDLTVEVSSSSLKVKIYATVLSVKVVERGNLLFFVGTFSDTPAEVYFAYTRPGEERPRADPGFGRDGSALRLVTKNVYVYTLDTTGFKGGVLRWHFWSEGQYKGSEFGEIHIKDRPPQLL